MKITETTTVVEVEREKVLLGITHLVVDVVPQGREAHALNNEGLFASAMADTEAEALDACFQELRAKIAARFKPVRSSP